MPGDLSTPGRWEARLARGGRDWFPGVVLAAIAVLVTVVSYRVMQAGGLTGLMILTGVLLAAVVLAFVSLRYLELVVLVWIVTLSGFRNLVVVNLPGIPDVTLDRIFLVWVIGIGAVKAIMHGRRSMPPYLLDVLIVLHTTYLLFSCLLSKPEFFNVWTRTYLMPTAAYFFGKYLLSTGPWFRRSMAVLMAATFYMGFTAIAEHYHWNALVWPRWILTQQHEFIYRSVGIFVQPGVLGTFIGMIMPFHFYYHLRARSAWQRWLHFGGILVCFVGLYFTYTRGSYIATVVGVLTLALSRKVYRRRVLAYGAVVAAVAALGFLNVQRDPFLEKRLKTEHTVTGRINVMATTLRMWEDKPLLGVGFLRYRDVRAEYRGTIKVPFFGLIKASHDERSVPHDIYIGILAEEGLVGGLMQFWMYYLIVYYVLRAYRHGRRQGEDDATDYTAAILASIVCYFVGGWAFDYRYFETLNSHFYLYAGVLVGWQVRARATAAVVSLGRTVTPAATPPSST